MRKHKCPSCNDVLVDIDDSHIQHFCPKCDKYFYVIRDKIMNEDEYEKFYRDLEFFNKKVDRGKNRKR